MPVTRSGKSSIATPSIQTSTTSSTSTSTSTSTFPSTKVLSQPKPKGTNPKNKNQKRNMKNELEDEKQTKRSKISDEKEIIARELSHQGIPKDVTDIVTQLSISPAVTAFYTLIEYCIKHNPTDAEIKLDPVTENELKIVEDRLGYTLPDDLRSIYLIHRNALCDHSLSHAELIPRFSTLSNPDIRGNDCDYKEISSDVVHFADHFEQNTWKLYHCKYGCIMQYCEEPDMSYSPRMLWFSVTHLLLSYVHMIRTFAPYWWEYQKYDIQDCIKHDEWEEKQRHIICQTEEGMDYDMNVLEIMELEYNDNNLISWETVIDEYLQQQQPKIPSKKKIIIHPKNYLISSEADTWAQQHRVYDESWDLSCDEDYEHVTWNGSRYRPSEFRDALESISYKE